MKMNQRPVPVIHRWLGMETLILGKESFYYPSKNVNLPFLIKKSLLPF